MKINQLKTVNVEAKEIRLHLKVSDRFTAFIHDQDGEQLGGQDGGYVPDFMPQQHYGDYVILNIDLDTGMVTNWRKPTAEQIEAFIAGDTDQ
ncbi:hypothetical protein V3390_09425 [Luteimonas sp. FXH3W]|uniref:DUF2442 domain-containing protein n=1 Tax=Aquilutibacter rugosus TaxID=3115820 RepID=A0ABU7V271_9GAMM